jgi:hypothetical protein
LFSLRGGIEESHPLAHVKAVIVKRPAADEVAVHHARFVDIDAAADFEIELALDPIHGARTQATRSWLRRRVSPAATRPPLCFGGARPSLTGL